MVHLHLVLHLLLFVLFVIKLGIKPTCAVLGVGKITYVEIIMFSVVAIILILVLHILIGQLIVYNMLIPPTLLLVMKIFLLHCVAIPLPPGCLNLPLVIAIVTIVIIRVLTQTDCESAC